MKGSGLRNAKRNRPRRTWARRPAAALTAVMRKPPTFRHLVQLELGQRILAPVSSTLRIMGYGHYSLEAHQVITEARRKAPASDVFKAGECHASMNPLGVKFRESCDSVEHPNSIGIVFALDVSGSMGEIPKQLATKTLPTFMDSVLTVFPDPQICFIAFGNANGDRSPLQVAQFESEAQLIDQWLSRIHLEGGGGALGESYDLAMYFATHHMAMDCWEKRKKKGYFFMTGDEVAFFSLPASSVKQVVGDSIEKEMKIHETIVELQKKFHVFFLIPDAQRAETDQCGKCWKDFLHERCIVLHTSEDTAAACALLLAVQEGALKSRDDVARQLETKMGRTGDERDRVIAAIAPFIDAIASNKEIAPPIAATLWEDAPKRDG